MAKASHGNVAKQENFSTWRNYFRSWINNSSSGVCSYMCISYSVCCTFSACSIGNKLPCLSFSGWAMEVQHLVSLFMPFHVLNARVMWMKGGMKKNLEYDGSKDVNVGLL